MVLMDKNVLILYQKHESVSGGNLFFLLINKHTQLVLLVQENSATEFNKG